MNLFFKIQTVFLALLFQSCSSSEEFENPKNCFPVYESYAQVPHKSKVWVFILAGQSNMAGRGKIEPQDTIPHKRILTINKFDELIHAKEPIHFYEPSLAGLDCGMSFGKKLLSMLPDSIYILLIPTAIGGTSIKQWIGDSTCRGVRLLSNFKAKVKLGQSFGEVKAVLWHQGETDAINKDGIHTYNKNLSNLFNIFRAQTDNVNLPILIGELGSYSKDRASWLAVNKQIRKYLTIDSNAYLIKTNDLSHNGDFLHFNAEAQRMLGIRYAEAYIKRVYSYIR